MALPLSRLRFLINGLVPLPGQTAATEAEQQDCLICMEPMGAGVHLPCHHMHVFCRKCITTWLLQPQCNSCPMCKTVFFSRNSHARPMIENIFDNADPHCLSVALAQVDWYLRQPLLRQTAGDALEGLPGMPTDIARVKGHWNIKIDTEDFRLAFILMAEIMPRRRTLAPTGRSGGGYVQEQLEAWEWLTKRLWVVMQTLQNRVLLSSEASSKVRRSLMLHLGAIYGSQQAVDAIPGYRPSWAPLTLSNDLDTLIDFVLMLAYMEDNVRAMGEMLLAEAEEISGAEEAQQDKPDA